MAWEYLTEVIDHGRAGASKGKVNRKTLDPLLAQRGQEGWELVHVWFDANLYVENDGHLLIFKRQK